MIKRMLQAAGVLLMIAAAPAQAADPIHTG